MNLERTLYNLGIPLSSKEFLVALVILTATITTLLIIFFPDFAYLGIFFPLAVLLLLDYYHGLKVRRVEEELPRFIHYLSSHPHRTLRDVIRLGTKGFGELSREMQGLEKMMERGARPSRLLISLGKRLGSPYVERVMESIVMAFRSGNTDELLRNLSEELYFVHELEGERRSALALQRYSILVSASFLVPFVLGLVTQLSRSLGGTNTTVLNLIPPYLLMLAFISGSFLAWTEGKPKNAPIYILFGGVVSLLVYWVMTW